MPTFDPLTAKSEAGKVLYHSADVIAGLEAWQELCEATGADAAAKKADALGRMIYGLHRMPADGDVFCRAEIENRFAEIHIHPRFESLTAYAMDDSGPAPIARGQFDIKVWRIARKSEISAEDRRMGFYLWFFDRFHWLAKSYVQAAYEAGCPRLVGVEVTQDPAFHAWDEVAAIGEVIQGVLTATWGDEIE